MSQTYYAIASAALVPDQYRFIGWPNVVYADNCYPIDVSYWNSIHNMLIPRGALGSFSFTLPLTTSGSKSIAYYDNPSCEGTPLGSSFNFPDSASAVSRRIYMKMTDPTAAVNESVSLDDTGLPNGDPFYGITGPSQVFDYQLPGAPTQCQIMVNEAPQVDTCEPLRIELRDSDGRVTRNTGPARLFKVTFKPSQPANSGLYSDPSCSTSISSLTISAGSTSETAYFRWNEPMMNNVKLKLKSSGLPKCTVRIRVQQ
jgi:hypothetical protein